MTRSPDYLFVVAAMNHQDLLTRCLKSILGQNHQDRIRVAVGDDASDVILDPSVLDAGGTWVPDLHLRWGERQGVLRNQVALIRAVAQHPDDVIVFVDGDDRLARLDVIDVLDDAYSDRTLLTYGSYEPDPPDAGCQPAQPYPPAVIRRGSFRRAPHLFNHLRTMRRRVFDQITDADLLVDGTWPMAGGDYALMMPALELAAPRIKFIPEVLLTYTSNRSDSEWRVRQAELGRVHHGIAAKPPKVRRR